MARKKRPSLVAEIGRLLVEYPEKDWRALVNRLRERALIEDIAAAIDDVLASVAKPVEKTRKVRRQPGEGVIAKVARDDEVKAEKLSALKSRLTDRDQRLPLSYIRGFASSLGMKEELANRRDQAVNQIVVYLAAKTTNEIDDILEVALSPQQTEGQEFDRWVKLILGDSASKEN